MAWQETDVLEQKELFIKAWLSGRYTKTSLCGRFGISRPTGDKWIARHFEEGLLGLCERSRRPKTHPNATPPELCEMLVAAKRERPHWGAKKLLDLLRREHPGMNWCADSTGDLILKRAGLVRPRRLRKRAPADSLPFGECVAANQCWSVDFKGDFPTGDGKRCWPLTVSDNFSRYLLLCRSLQRTRTSDVRPWFEALFREYGLPYAIRSDNGSPFASTALGGLSRLSKWWVDLGIRPERIRPGHPEENGRHERMHRSLKEYMLRPGKIAGNGVAQQRIFDAFRFEFNEVRAHEGLARRTPASLYDKSKRRYPRRIRAYEYGSDAEVRSVRHNGEIKWKGRVLYLSEVLAGERVGLTVCGDGIWEVRYRFHPLGRLDERLGKVLPLTLWHSTQHDQV